MYCDRIGSVGSWEAVSKFLTFPHNTLLRPSSMARDQNGEGGNSNSIEFDEDDDVVGRIEICDERGLESGLGFFDCNFSAKYQQTI